MGTTEDCMLRGHVSNVQYQVVLHQVTFTHFYSLSSTFTKCHGWHDKSEPFSYCHFAYCEMIKKRYSSLAEPVLISFNA